MKGIFHWSGDEEMTKYDMAVAMAKAFDLPTEHIKGDNQPSGGSIRPYNAKLDCSRLDAMGIGRRTPFSKCIKGILQPFFKKQ